MRLMSTIGSLLVAIGLMLSYTNGATKYNKMYGGTCGTCTDKRETCTITSVVIGATCPDWRDKDISCQRGFNSTRGVNNKKGKSYTTNSLNCGGSRVICSGEKGKKVWVFTGSITDSSCGKTYTCRENVSDLCEDGNNQNE